MLQRPFGGLDSLLLHTGGLVTLLLQALAPLQVSDEGGGIPRSGLPRIWTYLYSTANSPLSDMDVEGEGEDSPAVLAGYGYGLPLSRLYARYFGGDLQVRGGRVWQLLSPLKVPPHPTPHTPLRLQPFGGVCLQLVVFDVGPQLDTRAGVPACHSICPMLHRIKELCSA